MILKIITADRVHYRDNVRMLADWSPNSFKDNANTVFEYIGTPPFGGYGEVDGERELEDYDIDHDVIAWEWPKNEDMLFANKTIGCKRFSYKDDKDEQIELLVDSRCTIYLMSDEGKTIERLV